MACYRNEMITESRVIQMTSLTRPMHQLLNPSECFLNRPIHSKI